MSLITRKGAAWGTSRNHSLEPETDPIPLPCVITADQALSVADISPGISAKNEQRNVQGKREEGGESTLKKHGLC